ncbi:MAG: hypothetical protein U0R64_06290 [Candidatus Nanopelagicales bacterium]
MTRIPRPTGLTLHRRTVLGLGVGATAGVLTACSSGSLPFIASVDPDDEVQAGVAAGEQELLAAYDAVISRQPGLATRLRPIRDQHAQHLAAMATTPPLSSPSASTSPMPAQQAAALRTLRRLESRAVRQRTDAAVAAGDADLTELLTRIAASESGHVAALSGTP